MTREVKQLLKKRNTAFSSGDKALYSTAHINLKRGIKKAKRDYKDRFEDHLDSNNSRKVWQGVHHLTNYKTNHGAAEGDSSLAKKLNYFFAHVESELPEAADIHTIEQSFTSFLTVEEHEVRCLLQADNPRKAAGPNGVSVFAPQAGGQTLNPGGPRLHLSLD